jgi:[CysO sulfur-carrier protein]-S-L-cysteine hydrolase
MQPYSIPDEAKRTIYAHARAMFPSECCGYLRGDKTTMIADEVITCRNAQGDGVHPLTPERTEETGFVIAGGELIGFARTFDTSRPARVVYHSHTNGRAYFSETDRAMAEGPAYPVQHVVIGISPDGITEIAQYAWSGDARDFIEVDRWHPESA